MLKRNTITGLTIAAATALVALPAWSVAADDLADLSLEELMDIEVTSVSKRKQRLVDAPAAVSVISSDDISRSGMSSIPELLRLAPGMQVRQVDANKWAISARGFNDLFANKLLVLQDGRTLYTPLFSGVYWDSQDAILADIAQIEVIRGPGATLWGANAVNGVININTKPASETQGAYLSQRVGTDEQITDLRYGGTIGDQTHYRVYGKFRNHEDLLTTSGDDANDGWSSARVGARFDHAPSESNLFTFQVESYQKQIDSIYLEPSFSAPNNVTRLTTSEYGQGTYVLGRWTHTASPDSDFSLQAYVEHFEHGYAGDPLRQTTFDIDFQHRFKATDRLELIYGFGYRLTDQSLGQTTIGGMVPEDRDMHVFNAFVQASYDLVPDRLTAIFGTKFEYNTFTQSEIQPSAKLLWNVNDEHTLWTSVSRAVRVPSRSDNDISIVAGRTFDPTSGAPVSFEFRGDRDSESEVLIAYELGWRWQATRSLGFDVAAFYNQYDNLRNYQRQPARFEPTRTPPQAVVDLLSSNQFVDIDTVGIEVASTWQVRDNWKLQASYSFVKLDIDARPEATINGVDWGSDSVHQAQIRSAWDITPKWQLNSGLYYSESAGDMDDSILRLDTNVVYSPREGMSISAGVQNALDDRHVEFGTSLGEVPSEIPTMAYIQFSWEM
jgi:iron complex outermembrane recepter protein